MTDYSSFCTIVDALLTLSSQVNHWIELGYAPDRIQRLAHRNLNHCPYLCDFDIVKTEPAPSHAPPSDPSPSEELWLLHTSFDLAFASLAGQVKELAAKVNGSGPPPKVAAAKKPPAQPPTKPHAQPPTPSAIY